MGKSGPAESLTEAQFVDFHPRSADGGSAHLMAVLHFGENGGV